MEIKCKCNSKTLYKETNSIAIKLIKIIPTKYNNSISRGNFKQTKVKILIRKKFPLSKNL